MARRRSFGSIRRLPSKRYQASYIGPDLVRHSAPMTFTAAGDAEAWLNAERGLVETDHWRSPATRSTEAAREAAQNLTLDEFAVQWLADVNLRATTRRDYDSLLRNHISPALGSTPVRSLTKLDVRRWWREMDPDRPRARSKAFQLLHNIMGDALEQELIDVNPVTLPRRTRIRTKRAKQIDALSLQQLNSTADHMPDRLRMAVLLAAYCDLRYGELSELRRRDVDLDAGTLKVARGVVKVPGGYVVGEPKTEAGVRTVHIPPHLLPGLRNHLDQHAAAGSDGLLFPAPNGGHLHSSSFARSFAKAAAAAGRPDATPHTLRHTGVSFSHKAGATFAENKARAGHTSEAMTLLYTHTLDGADKALAEALSRMAEEGRGPGEETVGGTGGAR